MATTAEAGRRPPDDHRVDVVNPYARKVGRPPESVAAADPASGGRRRFADESRALALEHARRRRHAAAAGVIVGGRNATAMPPPVSARDIRRATLRWRGRSCGSDDGDGDDQRQPGSSSRPRLFLLRHRRRRQGEDGGRCRAAVGPRGRSTSSSSSFDDDDGGGGDENVRREARARTRTRDRSPEVVGGENGEDAETTGGPLPPPPPSPRRRRRRDRRRREEEGVWELDRGITEISGEGGSGKTQVCLGMCVSCVMTMRFPRPGSFDRDDGMRPASASDDADAGTGVDDRRSGVPDGHYVAIYASMGEGTRPAIIARRLEQMVHARLNAGRGGPGRDEDREAATRRILSRIVLVSIRNEDEFADFVDGDLPNLLDRADGDRGDGGGRHRDGRRARTNVGLVAFDGIAGFFRFSDPLSFQQCQPGANSAFYQRRGSRLLRISSRLRELSDAHDVPILITNQVTAFAADVGTNPSSSSSSPTRDDGEIRWAVPALGLAWSNCVTTRYILRRTDRMVDAAADEIRGGAERPGDAGGGKDEIAVRRKTMMRVREARILQSVNMPEDREVQFVVDAGDVVVVT